MAGKAPALRLPEFAPSPHEPPPSTYKIVLIGDAGVGKTALRERYLSGR